MKPLPEKIIDRARLIIQGPDPRKIIWINFAVTYLCDSRCRTCNIWRKYLSNPEEKSKELRLDEIRNMFINSQYLTNPYRISLTGGEPTLREDFVELCGFFIERYPKAEIMVSTNALNPGAIIARLEEINDEYKPKNLKVDISLDGIGKTHDEIRGVTRAYERVLKLIELVKERIPSVEQGVSFTITSDNYKDLLAVYELSKRLDIWFGPQFAGNSQVYFDNMEKHFVWNDTTLMEIEKVINVIRKRQRLLLRIGDISTYYLANMVRYEKYHQRICKCYSGTYSFFMDPYGNIFPCTMLAKKIGNIRQSDFDEIWTSKKIQQVREFINRENCACWTPCEALPSLLRNPNAILFNLSKIWA